MHLGRAIKRRRRSLGLTQKELAKRAGMTQGALSAIENHNKQPTAYCISAIAKALGVPVPLLYVMSLEPKDFGKLKEAHEMAFKVAVDTLMFICDNNN